MKQLKKKSKELDLNEIEVISEEVIPEVSIEEIEELEDWDNTLLDGLEDEDWDEDHAHDQVLNGMLEDFTDEEIQELINEIPEDVESIEQSVETDSDGEFVFEEGPYTFETDAEVAEIEAQQDEDFVVGAAMPDAEVIETPSIESIEEVVEQPKKKERRQSIEEDEEALLNYRKGPLWQYRTNKK